MSIQEHKGPRSPRRARKRPPDLIRIPLPQVSEPKLENENSQSIFLRWNLENPGSRVRIVLPEGTYSTPPDPPLEPPPLPSEILGLVVLGEAQSGRTSLVRRFVYRTRIYPGDPPHKKSTFGIEYHKKDLAFWRTKSESRCVRIQMWDTGNCRELGRSVQRNAELVQLLQRDSTKAIVLVLSLEHGIQHLQREAKGWKQWVYMISLEAKPIYLFLHKSDLLPALPTVQSIRIGAAISTICRDLGFSNWYMTSCLIDDGMTVEKGIMDVIRSNLHLDTEPSLALSSASSTASRTIASLI